MLGAGVKGVVIATEGFKVFYDSERFPPGSSWFLDKHSPSKFKKGDKVVLTYTEVPTGCLWLGRKENG